jgi:hypothetical protein
VLETERFLDTPPALGGRVFAGFDLLWQLGRLASLGLGGWLADAAGIATVYAAGTALLVAAAGIGFTGLRHNHRKRQASPCPC